MIQLIYASAATVPFTPDELNELLELARKKNSEKNITGLLVHHGGSFFQVLEGDEEEVDQLFKLISKDDRHEMVVPLLRQEIEERDFQKWRMGYYEAKKEDMKNIPGFSNFFSRNFSELKFNEQESRARELLISFRNGKWRQQVDS